MPILHQCLDGIMLRTAATTNCETLPPHIANNPLERAKQPRSLRFNRHPAHHDDHLQTKESRKQLLHCILRIMLITSAHCGMTDQSSMMVIVQTITGVTDLMLFIIVLRRFNLSHLI